MLSLWRKPQRRLGSVHAWFVGEPLEITLKSLIELSYQFGPEVDPPAPAPATLVSPTMQSDMRAVQRKGLKRGRKAKGKGKQAKGEKSKKAVKKTTLKRKKSKRDVLKKASPKKVAQPKAEKPTAGSQSDNGKKRKRGRANGEEQAPAESAKPFQSRIGEGKGWRYEVLPDQVFGCTNCRFIYGGCKSCTKEKFRGKTAAMLRQEMQEATESGASSKQVKKPKKAPKQKVLKGTKAT